MKRNWLVMIFVCLAGCFQSLASVNGLEKDWQEKLFPEGNEWKKAKQEFIFNNGTEPETLDPTMITGHPEFRLVFALFEGLVALHPESLKPIPGVAKNWQISNDKKTYTFYLRDNATWSNGKKINANTFVQSWKRALTPKTAAIYAYQLYPILGAKEFHEGKSTAFADVAIKALNEFTLEVKLVNPTPYFLDLCAFPTLFPVPVDVIKKHEDRWVRPENIVSNGPFVLKNWKPRLNLEMVKNTDYWDAEKVRLKRVVVYAYDSLDTAYKMFIKNELDWLPGLPLEKLDEIKMNPDYYVMPAFGSYFYRFNCKRKPFDDVRVRKAFSLAIDRKIITNSILKSGQQPATWFCPAVESVGYRPPKGLPTNVKLAQKLLAEAGYGEKGQPFPEIDILYNTSEGHKTVAEAIKQQWENAFKGVKVSLLNTEWKVYLEEMNHMNYTVCRSSWYGDYGDPRTFLDMFVKDGGNNRTGWSNSKYDELLAKTDVETNHQKRNAYFNEMEKILIEEEFPIMPIYMYVNQGLLKEKVLGWYENVRDFHPMKYIWIENP